MHKKFIILSFSIVLVFTLSCNRQLYQENNAETVLFPSPPDTARIQFLTKITSSEDVTGKQSKFKTFVSGEPPILSIRKPYGLDVDKNKIFVCDANIAGLEIIELEKGTFKFFVPEGRGKLKTPINCQFDGDGNLFVTDVERQQVVVYDENQKFGGEIGGAENFKPTDLALSASKIFVTDPMNNRINVYDKGTLELLFTFPEEASIIDDHWLFNPLNLCIFGNKVYVTDFGDAKVKIFDLEGAYISSIGGYGSGLSQFVRPKGIALDRDENLYVVDAAFENVQIFNKEGKLLMFFGGPYNGPGDMYLPANVVIDYEHTDYFEKYVDPAYDLRYLIFVTNQYGPDKVTVYGRVVPKFIE